MKNTRTRVKTKVYEMQLKLVRNQNFVSYSKDEDLRFHIERIQFSYTFKYYIFLNFNSNRIYLMD